MKTTRMIPKASISCDGCQYLIGVTRADHDRGLTAAAMTTELRIPWPDAPDDGFVTFHFHGPHQDAYRADCFRYWSQDPRIMARSLTDRGWGQDDIDAFLAIHLYRPDKRYGQPGKVVVVQS